MAIEEGEFAGRRLGAELNICSHPACQCTDVQIALKDEEDRLMGSFAVDVVGKAEGQNDEPTGEHGRALADQVIRGFDADDWMTLWKRFIAVKNRCTDDLDPSTLTVEFPMWKDIEEHGELVPFTAIFPHATMHSIEYPDETIVLDEQYCLARGCDCDRVALAFLTIANGAQRPGEDHMVFVNYRTGKIAEVDSGTNRTRKPEELFAEFSAKYPTLMATYAKRHKQITTLYASYWRRRAEKPVPTQAKVGRNERCPCGSGKKFKRCCGAN